MMTSTSIPLDTDNLNNKTQNYPLMMMMRRRRKKRKKRKKTPLKTKKNTEQATFTDLGRKRTMMRSLPVGHRTRLRWCLKMTCLVILGRRPGMEPAAQETPVAQGVPKESPTAPENQPLNTQQTRDLLGKERTCHP